MQRFQVRSLVDHDPHVLWGMLPPEHEIEFEDGEIMKTTNNRTLFSSFAWEFHRQYKNVPILKSHHVQHTMKGGPLNAKTHVDLLERISKDVIFVHQLFKPEMKDNILTILYSATNRIYNEATPYAEAHVTTLDLLDFIEVVDNPEIKMALSEVKPGVQSKDDILQKTYDKILKILNSSPELKNNGLSRMVRARLANNNQVLQCIAFRGFATEVDGTILKEPVLSNFVNGMYRLYDHVAESRSAAKSHYFAEAPLEDAEYFSRRLQLLTTHIEKINYQDCGTERYINWLVKPPSYDESGKMIYPGDLKFLQGKYYLEPDGKVLKELTEDDKHLYGKMIRYRSTLYCKEPDQHAVCSVCFGALSHNVSPYANLGHLCSATMTQQTTQSVLSTKHLDASSRSVDIVLTDEQRPYFEVTDSKSAYRLRSTLKDKESKIAINREQAMGLADAMAFDNFDSLVIDRITAITDLDVRFIDKGAVYNESVKIGQDKRRGVLTEEFLQYLRKNPWETDDKGNFVFNLKNWNFKLPFMMLPEMEYSFSDHSKQIAKMIESSVQNLTERSKPNSPAVTLQELFTKVNDKLNMNIAPLEVIINAIMIPEPGSYLLARGDENAVLGVADRLIMNRSLANSYAFKEQVDTLLSAKSFFPEGRPDSVFDVFFAPKELIEGLEPHER